MLSDTCKIRQYDCAALSSVALNTLCLFALEKWNTFPLNIQSGNTKLIIFTSDSSGYEDSNCFSLMEIKTCLLCQLLNVGIAAGSGIKYLIYSGPL